MLKRPFTHAAVALALLAGAVAGVSQGTATAAGNFQPCGNIASQFIWGLRADGVGCDKAKWVAKKYVRKDGGFSRKVTFNKWRCTRTFYGDGINANCKKRGRSDDEVRFARGG